MMGQHYHIETDGETYLIDDSGTLRFPQRIEDIPFKVTQRFRYDVLPGETIIVCDPQLAAHPKDWYYKDTLPERKDVDPIVQKAVNVSLPRCVVSAAFLRKRPASTPNRTPGPPHDPTSDVTEVLLVRAARGMTSGMWNIPGGFIHFNEHPEDAMRREVREELGIDARPGPLLGIYSELFDKPGHAHHLFCFAYLGIGDCSRLDPDKDEIEATRWFALEEAIQATRNPFAKQAFQTIIDHPERIPQDAWRTPTPEPEAS